MRTKRKTKRNRTRIIVQSNHNPRKDDTVKRQKGIKKKGPTKPNQKKHQEKDGTRASASGIDEIKEVESNFLYSWVRSRLSKTTHILVADKTYITLFTP